MNIFSLPQTEEAAIQVFQQHVIIPEAHRCRHGHEMRLSFGERIAWRCTKKGCKNKESVRAGTCFAWHRLSFVTVLRFVYCWADELTSVRFCEKNLHISHNTVVKWNAKLRKACEAELLAQENKLIGGEGMVVEIDESMFSRRKNNAGRILPQQWILGGLCRETKQCFLVQVPDRKAETLLSIIQANVRAGTTIYTDCWGGYKSTELNEVGYSHKKVNHSLNFVNPANGVHTQHIERLWGSAKWRNKKHRGTRQSSFEFI